MSEAPLAPCPHCGTANTRAGTRDGVPYVDCKTCETTIYFYRSDPTRAAIVWNSRAEAAPALDDRLRRVLWLRHGCSGLYGDDGEMQCGACSLDFKRDPIDKILTKLEQKNEREE